MSKKLKLKKLGETAKGDIVFCIKKQTYRGESFGINGVFYSKKYGIRLISSAKPSFNVTRFDDPFITLYVRGSEESKDDVILTCPGRAGCIDIWEWVKSAVAEYNAVEHYIQLPDAKAAGIAIDCDGCIKIVKEDGCD